MNTSAIQPCSGFAGRVLIVCKSYIKRTASRNQSTEAPSSSEKESWYDLPRRRLHHPQGAGQSLRYEEITQHTLAQKLISPRSDARRTMASRLYIDTLQENSRFVRAGKGVFGLAQRQPEDIESQVNKLNQATREQLRGLLLELPSDRFEALIGELLIRLGFDESTVTVTRRPGDGGIDVTGIYRATGLTVSAQRCRPSAGRQTSWLPR